MLQPSPELMRQTVRLASENVLSGGGGPFAALIVRDGVVIAEAVNTVFTSNDPTAHAEVNVIRKACGALGTFSLEGCEIYASSEPCPMCLAAIYWAHLGGIYYGNSCVAAAKAGFDDAAFYRELALDPDQRRIPARQILSDEAVESFRLWVVSPNKCEY